MLDKLEMLLALAREKHFARAAEALGVTQPTMSAGIKYLEETFDVLLVRRGSRFVGFTPEGDRVLDWARRIVGDSRAMKQDIALLKRGMVGQIRIASIPTASGILPLLTSSYRERHPGVRFQIATHTSSEILSLVENLEADAGITYLDNEPLRGVLAIPLYAEDYALLTSVRSRFGQRGQVTWREISEEPLCLLTPDMQNRRIIDQAFDSVGITVQPALTSNSIVVLYSHVRTGHWSSILSTKLISALDLPDGVRAIPIVEPAVRHQIGLVVQPRTPMSALIATLVQIARDVAESAAPAGLLSKPSRFPKSNAGQPHGNQQHRKVEEINDCNN